MQRNYFFEYTNKPNTEDFLIPTQEDFEEKYKDYFNELRNAAKYDKLTIIEKFKSTLLKSQFLKLLHDKNNEYSDCAIIHYAAKYNRPQAIQALVGHLNIEERLGVFLLSYKTKCTTLHFTSTINVTDDSNCSFEAASRIKELLYLDENHSFWLILLSAQQECLDTAVHYAARQNEAKLLNLLSGGLSSDEWLSILSIPNDNNRTAMHVYFINMNKTIDGSQKEFISAFRGSIKDEAWVNFLISKKVLQNLSPDNQLEHYCFQQIVWGLSSELADRLMSSWQTSKLNITGSKFKSF